MVFSEKHSTAQQSPFGTVREANCLEQSLYTNSSLKKKGRFSVLFSCENIGEGTERFSKKRQILWQEVPNIIEKHSAILLVHHKATHFFEQKKFREKQD